MRDSFEIFHAALIFRIRWNKNTYDEAVVVASNVQRESYETLETAEMLLHPKKPQRNPKNEAFADVFLRIFSFASEALEISH